MTLSTRICGVSRCDNSVGLLLMGASDQTCGSRRVDETVGTF